ncbi:hypothetical protein JW905_11865 [bacterium]|nr:hypothetical protein [candidate division CSSED10-310 bacterium]
MKQYWIVFACSMSLLWTAFVLPVACLATAADSLASGRLVGAAAHGLTTTPPVHVRPAPCLAPSDDQAVPNELINLRSLDSDWRPPVDRAAWTEDRVQNVPTSGQGLVDVIVGDDGYLYCGFYDDQYFPGSPPPHAVYIKRSTDGGQTWGNPDSGANGFALNGLFTDRPSLEVFQTTPGSYRLAVAVAAPYPLVSSALDIIVCWKDIGSTDDFTMVSVQNDVSENYLMPRIKAVTRPSNPSYSRLVCASYGYSDGRLWCDWSDTNGTSFGNYSGINPATDQVEVWRADFMEDTENDRLYCVWATAVLADPDHPCVLMALSTSQGGAWFTDLYRMSPASWNYCAEPDAAIADNPLQLDKTFMLAWSGQESPASLFNLYSTHQYLDVVSVGPGDTWNPSPTGFPVVRSVVYADVDYDNTMPAIIEDPHLLNGGYRVALVDQHQAALARVRYTECGFSSPGAWITPEIVTGSTADPARQGSTALSMGVGYGPPAFQDRRCAVWPDFRDPEAPPNNYCAWADLTTQPSPTFTPGVTATPPVTPTPTATPTAAPIPSLDPAGGIILVSILGGLLLIQTRIVRRDRET